MSVSEKLLKEFSCLICRKVMTSPLTTPCAHNFCKSCLLESYTDQSFMRERSREGGRTLRAQKVVKKCPNCTNDISDFLQNPQVNREIMDFIESLQQKAEEENADKSVEEENGDGSADEETDVLQKSGDDGSSGKVNGYASDSGVAEKSEYESNDTKKAAISKKESDAEDSELQSIDEGCMTKMSDDASGKRNHTLPEQRYRKKAKKSDDVSDTGVGEKHVQVRVSRSSSVSVQKQASAAKESGKFSSSLCCFLDMQSRSRRR